MSPSLWSIALLLGVLCVSVYGQKPAYCRRYDCPLFTENTSSYVGFSNRTYNSPSKWAATSLVKADGNLTRLDRRGMFRQLFRYINGANIGDVSYDMTLPVVKKFSPQTDGSLKVTMMFYLTSGNPATPTNADVTVVTLPRTVFVRGFRSNSKDASKENKRTNLDLLRADVTREGVAHVPGVYYQAGYGPRYSTNQTPRYDEIWLEATQ